MTARVYLDHNATTPLRAAARAAMLRAFDQPGNASSAHAEGRAARALLEDARAQVAGALGGPAAGVVLTSGGTEALNLVLTPTLEIGGRGFDVLLTGAGEHPAVLAGHRFAPERAKTVALTPSGALDLDALAAALAGLQGARPLLALQAANNETGAVQPVAAAAALVHQAGGALVCDAVQGAGKIPVSFADLEADALVVSGHKFGGPVGAAALCFREEASHIGDVMIRGGGQERGARAGTQNVAAVCGMAAALAEAEGAREEESIRLAALRDGLEAEILRRDPQAAIFGREAARLPNTLAFALPGMEAQLLLIRLDVEGVAVSAGSACASGKTKPSHVLAAMGVSPELAGGALRVSLGWSSTQADCARFLSALDDAAAALRARASRQASKQASAC
ncbi:cysteine desulfurase family protein [Methylocella sp.]|uniref:cysteine desulfurase family protein n=1 Tax=Methylocella sp. TaxID=1978226 RepID=UPI0037830B6D